jgi:hypothetical protein
MKKIAFTLSALLSITFVVAQQKIENGKYIAEDKLSYITIIDGNKFSFIEYYKWSPFTLEEKRKKENKTYSCGTVGYASNGIGEGIYQIENNQLRLKFTSFDKGMNKEEFDIEKNYKYFDLSKITKI